MKLLLKTLLQRRARDEGFTLPMVIALGLVMLLLAAVSITTANEENLTAITQNSRSDALAIAEVGVARYRELLDRNRILTVYDSSAWGTQTQICDNLTSFLPGVSKNISLDEDGQILNNDGDSTDSFTIGSYLLVSYDYTNDNPPATSIANGTFNMTNDTANNNARGILTIKGTASDNSEAQIQVDIPIRINLDDVKNLAPALWIGNYDSTTTKLGNLTIGNGNVVITDKATAIDGCRNFPSLATGTRPVISDSRNLPPIAKVSNPTATVPADKGDFEKARDALTGEPSTINTPDNSTTGRLLFGATTHSPFNPDANNTNCSNIKLCRYYYEFGSNISPSHPSNPSSLTSPLVDTDLLTDGVARTTLVLNQSLTINASGRDVKIGSTSPVANDSNAFEIYVNGNNNLEINATGGDVTINGFIHAPNSTLTINGNRKVTINGSVWVKDFVNNRTSTAATTATTISPDMITREPTTDDASTSGRAYRFYSTTARRTARPITGSPTNWKTEQVN
ncbi:DUF7305 domain-containing protein [Pleurocapsa sp. FMAR1]|uniref:DUF7305 domain-containing protein n=1 Tax=Pleurocapsa sp. FMAR1 TaxID=3040204 RepID=UPI0029C8B80D|nr:hypothetical protein [Pleurocapsa sp. FMAR1]